MLILQDFANKDILFSCEKENAGSVICRHCGRVVNVILSTKRFLVLITSKVHMQGEWCGHSNLKLGVSNIIQESMHSIENN